VQQPDVSRRPSRGSPGSASSATSARPVRTSSTRAARTRTASRSDLVRCASTSAARSSGSLAAGPDESGTNSNAITTGSNLRPTVTLILAAGWSYWAVSANPPKTPSTSAAKSVSSAPRQVMKFGEERAGKRDVSTVGKPSAFPCSPAPRGRRTSHAAYASTSPSRTPRSRRSKTGPFTFAVTANGAAVVQVTDHALQIGDRRTAGPTCSREPRARSAWC
jgi:hypothetical protein